MKDNKSELELEQARLERVRLELELEKVKQNTLPSDQTLESPKSKVDPPVSYGVAFCLTVLPPIGIILLWMGKAPIFIKILGTLFGLLALSVLAGWIRPGLPTWFVFMGQ